MNLPRLLAWLSYMPSVLAGTMLFCLMVMTFMDVILRSLFNSPIEAATELTRIALAIVVFSSLPVISAKATHIVVDILDPWLERIQPIRDAIVHLCCGVMLFWPIRQTYVLAQRAHDYGDITEYLAIPQFYIAYFVMSATAITALVFLVRGLTDLCGYTRTGYTPLTDKN